MRLNKLLAHFKRDTFFSKWLLRIFYSTICLFVFSKWLLHIFKSLARGLKSNQAKGRRSCSGKREGRVGREGCGESEGIFAWVSCIFAIFFIFKTWVFLFCFVVIVVFRISLGVLRYTKLPYANYLPDTSG